MQSGVSSIHLLCDKNICNIDFCTQLLPHIIHIKKLMHTIVASRYHKLEPEKEKPLTKHSLRVKYDISVGDIAWNRFIKCCNLMYLLYLKSVHLNTA